MSEPVDPSEAVIESKPALASGISVAGNSETTASGLVASGIGALGINAAGKIAELGGDTGGIFAFGAAIHFGAFGVRSEFHARNVNNMTPIMLP